MLWDDTLSQLPNSMSDIAPTLEREILLRIFNRNMLGMGNSSGSRINRLIGVRTKVDPESGVTDDITNFYPSYERNVIHAFETYPVAQTFGLSIVDAMALPADQWYRIRKSAERVAASRPPEGDNQVSQLVNLVRDVVLTRRNDEQ